MTVHGVKRQAELPKAVAMHGATLATANLRLEATKTSQENTELKLQTKFFPHKHTCSCLFAESAGVWHGMCGSLRKETGAKLAWLRFSEFWTHGS